MPRPKSFDPDTVLHKAMGVFWEKGYDAASISDLTAAMGINRFSLYDTFGDKHSLYIKALESYEESIVTPILERINAFQSIGEMEEHLMGMIDYQREHSDALLHDPEGRDLHGPQGPVHSNASSTRRRINEAFVDVFSRLIDEGQLRDGIRPDQAAWLVMLVHSGITGYAGTGFPSDQAKKDAVSALFDSIR
ncbi:MAG: TetR/AcrR family transcriptional regulator [Phycisphaerales bacterium]